AGVFTVLNMLLYYLLSTALNLGTLWMFFFIVPFVANAIILLLTDRILKPFKIESMTALMRTAAIVTVAHFILRIVKFYASSRPVHLGHFTDRRRQLGHCGRGAICPYGAEAEDERGGGRARGGEAGEGSGLDAAAGGGGRDRLGVDGGDE